MSPNPLALSAVAAALVLMACERKTVVFEAAPATPIAAPEAKTKTMETSKLGGAIDTYEVKPTPENAADVRKALADLDGEIAELDLLVEKRTGSDREEAAAKAKNLKAYRTAEVARFTAAQAKAGLTTVAAPPGDARTGAEKVEDSARRVGESVENAVKQTGEAIKDAVR